MRSGFTSRVSPLSATLRDGRMGLVIGLSSILVFGSVASCGQGVAQCDEIAFGTDIGTLPASPDPWGRAEYYDGEIGPARSMSCCADARCDAQTSCACDSQANACQAGSDCASIDCTDSSLLGTAVYNVDEPYSGLCRNGKPSGTSGEGHVYCSVWVRDQKVVAVSWFCRD